MMRECANFSATRCGIATLIACNSPGAVAVPNLTPARKNTVGASGSWFRLATSPRSHGRVSTPRCSKAARSRNVLKRETVETAVRNGLQAHQAVTMLPGVIPTLSNDAEFFPGLKKSWSYTFMVNDEDAPTGRPAGALGWAGLPNLFYWIDRKNGFGGYWATQILPFGDPISFGAYMDFETAAYAAGQARAAA